VLDELDMALSATHGSAEAEAVGAAVRGAAGEAAIAPVGTATSEAATAAAVIQRAKRGIPRAPIDEDFFNSPPIKILPPKANLAE
jgi:hypothetical protein